MKAVIIAEIGENHLGKMDLARRLVRDAAAAGADIVKFQSYLGRDFPEHDPERDWFFKVQLSDQAHFELKRLAGECQVEFLSAPFSLERARFLCEKLGLRKIKIASGMMLNFPVLDYLNSVPVDTVFLSTGMAVPSEIKAALSQLGNVRRVFLLHCVTQYPCLDEEANLAAIPALRKKFKLPVGYSDHTVGIDACLAAAALGAGVIEKHFTFDKHCSEGTDHVISADAADLQEMVRRIRRIELMLGSGKKKPSAGERKIRKFVRSRFSA